MSTVRVSQLSSSTGIRSQQAQPRRSCTHVRSTVPAFGEPDGHEAEQVAASSSDYQLLAGLHEVSYACETDLKSIEAILYTIIESTKQHAVTIDPGRSGAFGRCIRSTAARGTMPNKSRYTTSEL